MGLDSKLIAFFSKLTWRQPLHDLYEQKTGTNSSRGVPFCVHGGVENGTDCLQPSTTQGRRYVLVITR